MEVPQKTKNGVTIWFSKPIPGNTSRENNNLKKYIHPNIHSSAIYNSQDMKATWMSIERWMDKEYVPYTHTHTHTHTPRNKAIKKSEIMPFPTLWMDLEIITQVKSNIWYHLYVESKKWYKWTYLQNKNSLRHRKQTYSLPKRKEEKDRWGLRF